jgi:PAS domain S-box-containing protein
VILAVDAFRTLFESVYFGAWYTALVGFLPQSVYAFLVRPEIVFIPKLLNVIAAIVVIVLLIYRWIPQEEREKDLMEKLVKKRTSELAKSNATLKKEIVERRQMAESLMQSEMLLRTTQKLAKVGGWEWNVRTQSMFWTDETYRIHGLNPSDNMPDIKKRIEQSIECYNPEDRPVIKGAFDRCLNDGKGYDLEFPFTTVTGVKKWIRTTAEPVKKNGKITKIIGNIIDITNQKQVENALRESEEQQRSILQSAMDGFWLTDNQGRLLEVNETYCRMSGYSELELLNMGISDLEAIETAATIGNRIQKIEAQGEDRFESRHKRKDGSLFDVEISVQYRAGEGGRTVCFLRDITDRKRIAARLQQNQKMESIGNLAGGIAHDFNNILSSIIGFTELALDDAEKGSGIEDSLQEILSAGKRARDLVKQILAFARQSEGEIKPLQVNTIAKEVLKFIRSSIPAAITIKENINSDSVTMGNPTQVHQIIMNLCTNAAQAMEDRGGILEVTLNDVEMDNDSSMEAKSLKPGNYLELTISDTGAGIDPEIIDKIFEPYFTTKEQGQGTGMGLAMVHGIVEKYGGKVSVNSTPGQGTLFAVYLPVIRQQKEQRTYEPEVLPTGTERILFVDDEAPLAKMGSQILERLGYSVTTRISSMEALEMFRAEPDDFDLVISDVTMPSMTGDELAIEMMKIRPDIPIILCTGYSKKISDESAAHIGIKAFAYKPIVKAELAKTVRTVLDAAKG